MWRQPRQPVMRCVASGVRRSRTTTVKRPEAGVITLEDGTKTAFMGSANETYQAWKLNYELGWEDDSPEAITWVQEEFDALWRSPLAVDLAEFVIEDIGRISRRILLPEISDWKDRADPAEAIVEMPVYRREYGL